MVNLPKRAEEEVERRGRFCSFFYLKGGGNCCYWVISAAPTVSTLRPTDSRPSTLCSKSEKLNFSFRIYNKVWIKFMYWVIPPVFLHKQIKATLCWETDSEFAPKESHREFLFLTQTLGLWKTQLYQKAKSNMHLLDCWVVEAVSTLWVI